VNGNLVPEKKAVVSIHDHGFLYGDGVYETMRVYGGQVFRLDEHLRRLRHSAGGIGLRPPMSYQSIGGAVRSTVRANRLNEAVVRLTLTRGPGLYGFDPRLCPAPTLVIVARPFVPYPAHYHSRGVTAAVVGVRRNSPLSLPPHVKSTSCLNGILAKVQSLRLGAKEGIMLTLDGFFAEGTVSNVFLVKNKVLSTPLLEGHLLAGVTRDWVCRLARKAGYTVQEKKLPLSAAVSADEMFLTNTTWEVLPVKRLVIADQPGRVRKVEMGPGPVTRDLLARFRESIGRLSAGKLPGGRAD
jgi:branched-chain amino acid aminotransferase